MRHKMSAEERDDLQVALQTIGRIIGYEYPEPTRAAVVGDDVSEVGEAAFQWGIGDGFRLALRGLVDAAFPGWRNR